MKALPLALFLWTGTALASVQQLGNPFNLPSRPSVAGINKVDTGGHSYLAIRFTAHQSAPVKAIGLYLGAVAFSSNGPDTFSVDIYPSLASGSPDLTRSLFSGSFIDASLPASVPAWIEVVLAPVPPSTALAAGTTYFLVIHNTGSGNATFTPAALNGTSDIEPVFGRVEPVTRNLWVGGGVSPLPAPLNKNPLFYVTYDAPDVGGTCSSLPPNLADGTPYTGYRQPILNPGDGAGERFEAGALLSAVLPRPSIKVFAVEMPLIASAGSAPVLRLVDADAGVVLGQGPATSTGKIAGPGGSYTWFRAFVTSRDGGAPTLFLDGGSVAVEVQNDPTATGAVQALGLLADSASGCDPQNAATFEGGSFHATGFAQGVDQPDASFNFLLCSSEIVGDGIDEDCSGADEADAGALMQVCRDFDDDNAGDPSDSLELTRTVYASSLPPGYVADCSDCDDRDPTVYAGECDHNPCTIHDVCNGTCTPGPYADPGSLPDGGTAAGCAPASATLSAGPVRSDDAGSAFAPLDALVFNGFDAGYGGQAWGFQCDGGSLADGGSTALGDFQTAVYGSAGETFSCAFAFGDGGSSNPVTVSFPATTGTTGSTGSTGTPGATGSTGTTGSTGSTGAGSTSGGAGSTGSGGTTGEVRGASSSGSSGGSSGALRRPASYELGGCSCNAVPVFDLWGLLICGLALRRRRR